MLLIGQAPGRAGDPSVALDGRVGRRLAGLMGLTMEEYMGRVDRLNLLPAWTGRDGKGDAWDAERARENAEAILPSIRGRRAVLLGRNVAAAFGLKRVEWMTWTDLGGVEAAAIPHPSGIVLWWNDAENRRRASEFLRESLRRSSC